MPDISQSSQATLSQALTQLSQLASTSDVTRQGVDVLVKHLAGNVLSLSKSTGLLNKVVLLNNPQINGNLIEGQTHQVKLTLGNNPSLEFFSQTSAKTTTIIPLTEQQLQSLLRLPAKQLISRDLLANLNQKNILPVINATVLSVLSKEQLKTLIPSELLKLNIAIKTLETNNTALSKQQNILTVSLTDQRPPLELSIPLKQLNQFSVGEKITLAIVPKGNHWQLTIQQNTSVTANQSKNSGEDKVQLKSQRANSALSALNSKVTKDQQNILSPLLATPLIKASLQQAHLAKPIYFELAIKPVLQQLSKINSQINSQINNEQNQGLLQKLQTLPIDKLTLQIKPNGEIELHIHNAKPVANIPVTKEIAQALAALKLPNKQALDKLLNLSIAPTKPTQAASQASRSELNLNTQKPGSEGLQHTTTDNGLRPIVPPVDGSKSQEIRLSMKDAGANLLAEMQQRSMTQSVISPSLLANTAEQINLVQSLLRIVQARAETPTITLQSIEKALVDVEFFKGAPEQSSKQLVEQLLQQIKQALPQGKDQDANQIRQILTTPALNLSTLQMINPTSSQGFMSGLVTLLQMSLSARLAHNQSSRVKHITESVNEVLSVNTKLKKSVTPKAMVEMSQLEQKHQLMKEIGRLLSGHQANKLGNAEQMIQGQETFYYNLPSALGGTIKDIELLIKREESDKENTSFDEKSNKIWQLTMKLAVGDLGELLTKAKLRANTLEINFYASNDTVKIQVMNYLPLLRRKLDSLGIEVSKSQCQLGKIPDTLQQRPYHMFQAKA